MNKIDLFLNKVGRQTLLTAHLMREGTLDERDSAELKILKSTDLIIDNDKLQQFNSIFGGYSPMPAYAVDKELDASLSEKALALKSFIKKVNEIENEFYIPSLHTDLMRLKAFNDLILNSLDVIDEPIINALLFSLYVNSTRFSVYPTSPINVRSVSPVIISDPSKERESDMLIEGDVLLLGLLNEIIPDFQLLPPMGLIERAAEVFDPAYILKIAESFTSDRLYTLDEDDSIMSIIAAVRDAIGYIDYRLLLIEMLYSKLKQVFEDRKNG